MFVKTSRKKLLEVLRQNRQKHLDDFDQALSVWRDQLLEEYRFKMATMAMNTWKD